MSIFYDAIEFVFTAAFYAIILAPFGPGAAQGDEEEAPKSVKHTLNE